MKRRLLFFIPSLLFISLIGFIITVSAPGDPVIAMLHDNSATSVSAIKQEQEVKLRHQLGLDLPLFYFSIHALAEPDTLYKIFPIMERKMLLFLVRKYGNWNAVSAYYLALKTCHKNFMEGKAQQDSANNYSSALSKLLSITTDNEATLVKTSLKQLETGLADTTATQVKKQLAIVTIKWNELTQCNKTWRNSLPVMAFHPNNQFHRWLFGSEYSKGIIRGDLGTSYTTQQPVLEVLLPKIRWSLALTIMSLIVSLIIAIPLSVYTVRYPSSLLSKTTSVYSNLAYATPVFWLATLLLVTLANPSFIKLFPASGVALNGASGFNDVLETTWYLILPLICYCYASIAFLTNTVKNNLKQTLSEPFIQTAYAKGLTKKLVIYKHALPNTLLPLITLVINVFPAAISGSVIIENIFSIPGIGNEITQAIFTQNYPVLVAIVMITGFMTLTGFLLGDVLYSLVDPRIRAANEK